MASQNNAQIALNFYMRQGLKPWQAAAFVGTLMQESGPNLNPVAKGDNGTAFGIAQWRGDRFNRLKAFAKKKGTTWDNFQTQLEYSVYEGQNYETYAWNKLRAAQNVEQAAAAAISYERPLGWTRENPKNGHGWSNRLKFAVQMMGHAKTMMSASDQGENMGGPVGSGPDNEPAYDSAAKDDMIPGAKAASIEDNIYSEEDTTLGEDDMVYGGGGMNFDEIFSAEEMDFATSDDDDWGDGIFGDLMSSAASLPPPESMFSAYWPSHNDETGLDEPPPPPPQFGGVEELPTPSNIFRARLLGFGKEEDV